jgi:hypothetical protein
MAYEDTSVSVSKSQESIRKLLRDAGSVSFAAVSDIDPTTNRATEGFHSKVVIGSQTYSIRIMANVPSMPEPKRVRNGATGPTAKQLEVFREQAERKIWRVLYYHMKDIFEASASGVLDFRELILPYLVMADGSSVAEHVLPRLDSILQSPRGLLGPGK